MRPLAGIRILDFTHVLAGPFATRILGDLGADVVKVNSVARAASNDAGSPYYQMWNRNKRALALDMSRSEARDVCRNLAVEADVVIDNFSVGVLDRWGIGFDAVSELNPGVIYVQMSGMGNDGPWSKFVTYAPTIHALSGLTHLTGVPGREDIGVGFSYNDHVAGLHGAVAMLAAIEARRHTGRGQRVDLSQFEVGVSLLGPALLDFFANGVKARPSGNRLPHDAVAPHGCYQCIGRGEATVDERWVAIACMNDDQWQRLRDVMGNPAWAEDAAFATAAGRAERFESLDVQISAWTADKQAAEVMERCQAAGVPAGVVQNGIDLVERDPQLEAQDFLIKLANSGPDAGAGYTDRLPIAFEKTPCETYRPTQPVGADNVGVLADWLGMSEGDVHQGEADGYFT